ncbi:MAG: hypothetical protein MUF70_03195 [Myxococcota bacterium]|nr:hypothetical protein [Myxococcota bacterium]
MSAAIRRALPRAAWALLALLLAVPGTAAACPMCLSGQGGGTGKAFAIGSLFLSITPLAVIGSAVWYLRRRARALRDAEDARALSVAPRP